MVNDKSLRRKERRMLELTAVRDRVYRDVYADIIITRDTNGYITKIEKLIASKRIEHTITRDSDNYISTIQTRILFRNDKNV